jgi:hypothetical protein
MVAAPSDLSIDDLLVDLGYRTDAARQLARAALVDAGLTSGRKSRIAAGKLPAVNAALASRFAIVCARTACRSVLPGTDKSLIDAARPTDCSVCGGSANESAIDRAVAALHGRGMRKVVVVGGSPTTHEELRSLVRNRLELRLVSGTDRRTRSGAKADLAWADLVVIWGATQLDHKVSKLYTDGRHESVVTCGRRGIEALAETVRQFASRR